MATMDTMPSTGAKGLPAGRPSWMMAAIALLVVAVVALGALWLSERSTVGDLEAEVAAAEAAAESTAATVAAREATIGDLQAQVAAAEATAAPPISTGAFDHPDQAEVQSLYDGFLAAIADPDAETVASFFMPGAVNVAADGTTTLYAEAIGSGYESYGPLHVANTDGLIVTGDGVYRAALRGRVSNTDGLLVTTIVPTGDGLKFSRVTWYAG